VANAVRAVHVLEVEDLAVGVRMVFVGLSQPSHNRDTLICHNKQPFSKLTACTDPLAARLTAL